jgi:hypothetical protein
MEQQKVRSEDVIAEVESVGWNYLDHRPYSDYPGDWYLHIVLAARPNRTEYVTWIYNASLGGLHGGRYFVSHVCAMTDYIGR